MRQARALWLALTVGSVVLSSAFPAGAHLSAYTGAVPPTYALPPDRGSGSVTAAITASPDLPFFPCALVVPPGDAMALYGTTQPNPNWDSGRYANCYGDFYTGAEGAVNLGRSSGAGVWHGTIPNNPADDKNFNWNSTGPGVVTANFSYAQPCVGNPPQHLNGEAIGWIRIIDEPAIGQFGLNLPITKVTLKLKFWWSRAGLVGTVGLDDPIIDFNAGDPPAPFAITKFNNGPVAATFISTVLPDCAAVTHTHPNDILISGGFTGTGNGLLK